MADWVADCNGIDQVAAGLLAAGPPDPRYSAGDDQSKTDRFVGFGMSLIWSHIDIQLQHVNWVSVLYSQQNPLAAIPNGSTYAAGLYEKGVLDILAESLNFTFVAIVYFCSIYDDHSVDDSTFIEWTDTKYDLRTM